MTEQADGLRVKILENKIRESKEALVIALDSIQSFKYCPDCGGKITRTDSTRFLCKNRSEKNESIECNFSGTIVIKEVNPE